MEKNRTGREMFMWQKEEKRKTRKINQNVHTSFVSFDWQSNINHAEARSDCFDENFNRKSSQLKIVYNQHFRFSFILDQSHALWKPFHTCNIHVPFAPSSPA